MSNQAGIESLQQETRRFKPSAAFCSTANIKAQELEHCYTQAAKDPELFWAERARSLSWFKEWQRVLEWNCPYAKWFVGGKINASYNCLDRHVNAGLGEKAALIWEGEPGEVVTLSYNDLLAQVCRCANALVELGVKEGDRIAIYMPLVPEAIVAMLACARIGATHSVIFGGFSADAIADRVNDAKAGFIITADGGFRRGKIVELKANVDSAFERGMPSVKKVLVLKRTGQQVGWNKDRDLWWHELVAKQPSEFKAYELDSEHPLFVLYTSGTTGKPKGIVHTTGGYMVGTHYTSQIVFDLKPDDIYWCSADVGWVTGHSYVVYGPLSSAATIFIYEGAPDAPDKGRFWQLINRHKVTIFYTAPTAIRNFMRWGDDWVKKHDLSTLRLLGSVGEPINPEAWIWYQKTIGQDRCPIVDTWWQTETGAIMITPVPGATETKPGSATLALPGVDAAIVNNQAQECSANEGGYLVIRKPWPSMLRGILNDPERYQAQYWSKFSGWYYTGDGARRDEDGYFWIMGRLDDVLNVAGHRLGTAEIESALVSHPAVAEAAVVGAPDEIKGEAVHAFVTLRAGAEKQPALESELKAHVAKMIGALARPERVLFAPALPKTRSGKIMRRLLRQIAKGERALGDITTLEDSSVLEQLRGLEEE